MLHTVPDKISKHVFYPLWDWHDRSRKLHALQILEKNQWDSWQTKKRRQWEKLQDLLHYAIRFCPYYQGRIVPDSETDFQRWPILSKEDIRNFKEEILSRPFSKEQLVRAKTGGSTGMALEVYLDKDCQQQRNACALRSDKWSGWDLGQPRGALWGNPPETATFKQKTRRRLLDRVIFLDTMALNDQTMKDFTQQLLKHHVHHLFGHAHSLFLYARYLKAHPEPKLKVRGIISTSMMLLTQERQGIEEVFGCPVTNRYGCEEVGLIACECERHEGLHINVDQIYLEVLKQDGSPAVPDEEGRIVVTDLINRGMPLIRYEVGDVGALSSEDCSCGRGLPLLKNVTGRTADFLIRRNGTLVAGVSLVERTLTAIPGLVQLQIIQTAPEEVVLNIVPDQYYTPHTEDQLREEMRRSLGENIRFVIRKATRLEQEKNGKYRFSICRIQGVTP